MRVCVCVKQVPDTQNIRIDPEKGTLIRSGVQGIMNPYDESALEMALEIKDRLMQDLLEEVEITVISMGIPSVYFMLRYTLALGADRAFLLTSPAFAGSDTLATSYILGRAILKTGPYDLILMGKQAIDGDTAQVGPEVASTLELPIVTFVTGMLKIEQRESIYVARFLDDSEEHLRVKLPAVLTVIRAEQRLRMPGLEGLIDSYGREVIRLSEKDIQAEPERCGLKGSPTRVKKVFAPEIRRQVEFIEGSTLQKARKLREIIKKINIS